MNGVRGSCADVGIRVGRRGGKKGFRGMKSLVCNFGQTGLLFCANRPSYLAGPGNPDLPGIWSWLDFEPRGALWASCLFCGSCGAELLSFC